ncbi:hypothetical protein HDU92_005571 [Lobulomyces angularis]|nr:hypothetical protein HDU92_005571 [Lobulomyces angularis]
MVSTNQFMMLCLLITSAALVKAANIISDSIKLSARDSCSWPGHCEGSKCATHDDCADSFECRNLICSKVQVFGEGSSCTSDDQCDGDLECRNLVCSKPIVGSCSWPGHCLGDVCASMDECADDLTCINGLCGKEAEVPTPDVTTVVATTTTATVVTGTIKPGFKCNLELQDCCCNKKCIKGVRFAVCEL